MAGAEIVFLGYLLSSCSMKRQAGVLPKKIIVNVANFNLNEEAKQFRLSYEIHLIGDSNEDSVVVYDAYFYCGSDQLRSEFKKIVEGGMKVFPKGSLLKEAITSMIQLSFPYIRQALTNMTNDIGGSITIPMIDSRELIENGLEFNRLEKSAQPTKSKKVRTKKESAGSAK